MVKVIDSEQKMQCRCKVLAKHRKQCVFVCIGDNNVPYCLSFCFYPFTSRFVLLKSVLCSIKSSVLAQFKVNLREKQESRLVCSAHREGAVTVGCRQWEVVAVAL